MDTYYVNCPYCEKQIKVYIGTPLVMTFVHCELCNKSFVVDFYGKHPVSLRTFALKYHRTYDQLRTKV